MNNEKTLNQFKSKTKLVSQNYAKNVHFSYVKTNYSLLFLIIVSKENKVIL